MSTSAKSTGRSPGHARALELVRAGMTAMDVSIAVGIPTATIKRWATAAGLTVTAPTAQQRAERQERWERERPARRAYAMQVTARMVRR